MCSKSHSQEPQDHCIYRVDKQCCWAQGKSRQGGDATLKACSPREPDCLRFRPDSLSAEKEPG